VSRPDADTDISYTRLDAWFGRLLSTPSRQRLWYWGAPLAVTLLAAILRLWHLGTPHALVFDETFYVKDSETMRHLGYEGSWPEGADAKFNAGDTNIFTSTGSYVAHPPLGKWIISLGLDALGAANSVGWRISTALIGIIAVFVLIMIARKLFESTLLATLAGLLFAIDGSAIVMSRTSLLDNYVMFFGLLGFWAVLLDRDFSARKLEQWMSRRTLADRTTDWGPTLWNRPWLLAAGAAFGAASAVKWSGLYFLAAFALYTVVSDALVRRSTGITFWGSGTLVKQGPATFLLMIPVAAATYCASWTGWFVTRGGYYRDYADLPGQAATGFFRWVPHSIQSFFHYQQSVYNFNVGEHSPHAYAANPFGWFFLLRPTAFYYAGQTTGQDGCTSVGGCAQYITSIPNPLLWFAAIAALIYLVYRLIRRREWQVGLILMGTVAGYLPWLMYSGRTIFQFYTIAFLPYLILGLVVVFGALLGTREDPAWRRLSGIRMVAGFLVLVILVSAFFYPVNIGAQVPVWFAQLHYVFPGWR
jgi:dolichyl-phosphate-mannose-protein mannosyltransferase